MQTIICSLIIFAAFLYVVNRWVPAPLKSRLMTLFGNTPAPQSSSSSGKCSACSSCGNCGSNAEKMVKK